MKTQYKVKANNETGFWEIHDSAGFVCKLESESTAKLLASAPLLSDMLEEAMTIADIAIDLAKEGRDYETAMALQIQHSDLKKKIQKTTN